MALIGILHLRGNEMFTSFVEPTILPTLRLTGFLPMAPELESKIEIFEQLTLQMELQYYRLLKINRFSIVMGEITLVF